MKSFFNKRFEEEVLINEKLRTKILACMFLFAMLYTFINGIILKERGIKQDEAHSLSQMFIFQLALFIFEVLTWLRIVAVCWLFCSALLSATLLSICLSKTTSLKHPPKTVRIASPHLSPHQQ